MSERTSVPVATLRQAAEVLLAHVEGLEGEVILLDRDYYWSLSPEQIHDAYHEPSDFSIGQLSECLANLDALVADPTRATSYALVWLGDLMRAVGQTVVK